MRYFVSYAQVFKKKDDIKRESFRLQTYNMMLRFLTRKNIEGNLICYEFSKLKDYFQSRDFTDTYFLSPYILNENQLATDLLKVVTCSGETNSFNKIASQLTQEVNDIRLSRGFRSPKVINVKTADEYLDRYMASPHSLDRIELNDPEERKWLKLSLIQGYRQNDAVLSVLYLRLMLKNAADEGEVKKTIDMTENLIKTNSGNSELMKIAADCYLSPIYKQKDKYGKAFAWHQKAAELNDPDSLYLTGLDYFMGSGTAKDPEKAFGYWSKAAKLNNAAAISGIGIYYLYKKDKKKAKEWLERSAALGDDKALLLLDTDFDRK